MFKLEGSSDCYLFVKPGMSNWSIWSNLVGDKRFIKSGRARHDCPAHPVNNYGGKDIINWEFNKTVKTPSEDWEQGGITLHCSIHDDSWLLQQAIEGSWKETNLQELANHLLPSREKILEVVKLIMESHWEKTKAQALFFEMNREGTVILSLADHKTQQLVASWNQESTLKIAHLMPEEFIQWLISRAREGEWEKQEVGSVVCRNNRKGELILSSSDFETQREVSFWNRERINEVAQMMGSEFLLWLIQQAAEGNWERHSVAHIMCSRNKDNVVVMATLNQETQKQVAVFNQAETCSILPFIDNGDFLQWLYQEAVAGRWDQNLVFGALAKEEVDGNTVVVTRRKKGTKSIII